MWYCVAMDEHELDVSEWLVVDLFSMVPLSGHDSREDALAEKYRRVAEDVRCRTLPSVMHNATAAINRLAES